MADDGLAVGPIRRVAWYCCACQVDLSLLFKFTLVSGILACCSLISDSLLRLAKSLSFI